MTALFYEAFSRYSMAVDGLYTSSPWREQEVDFTNYPSQPWVLTSTLDMNMQPHANTFSAPVISDSRNARNHCDGPSMGLTTTNGLLALPSAQPRMCPLIIGEVHDCQPSRCGPDAPCLKFSDLPPIEECTTCIQDPSAAVRSRSRQPDADTEFYDHMTTDSTTTFPSLSAPATLSRQGSHSSSRSSSRRRNKVSSKTDAKQRAKAAHSLVEKKYRENLNSKMISLHDALRTARFGPGNEDSKVETDDRNFMTKTTGLQDSTASIGDFKKSDVLTDAVAYVNQTEREMENLNNEVQRLRSKIKGLESLTKCEDCSILKSFVQSMQVHPV
jgi:hypothetical protein